MPRARVNDRRTLLRLTEQVAGVDADLGSPASQAWFSAAIDSLAHALVDLSDGRRRATVAVAAPAAAHTARSAERDRASCAAASAELSAVRTELATLLDTPRADGSALSQQADTCLSLLVCALSDLASAPVDHATGAPGNAHRNLRAAFRVVQPPAQPT